MLNLRRPLIFKRMIRSIFSSDNRRRVAVGIKSSLHHFVFVICAGIQILIFCIALFLFKKWGAFDKDGASSLALGLIFVAPVYAAMLAAISAYSVFSLIKSICNSLSQTELSTNVKSTSRNIQGQRLLTAPEDTPVDQLIQQIQMQQGTRCDGIEKTRRICATTGLIITLCAIAVPLFTWLMAVNVSHNQEKLLNFWSVTFSAASLGAITISVGIALLKHSIKLKASEDSIQESIDILERARLLLSWPGTEAHIYEYARILAINIIGSPNPASDELLEESEGLFQQVTRKLAVSAMSSSS